MGGTLDEMAAWRDRRASESTITLLLPAEWLLLTEVSLPTRQAGKRAQALPFALEEHLLQDPANLHCVSGVPDGDGRSAAAAMDRERLQGVLVALADAGLSPSRALPDALCLPLEAGRLTVLNADGRCLLRWGAAHAIALPSGEQDAWRDAVGDALPAETWTPPGDWHAVLSAGAGNAPLDLLHGEFAPAGRPRPAQALRWPAVLAAAVLVLALAVEWAEAWQMQRHSDALADEIGRQYLELFPGAREVPADPAARVQIALRAEVGRAGTPGGDLVGLLRQTAPLLAEQPGLSLQQLRYQDGELELQVRAQRVDQLDALAGRFMSAGLDARLGATRVDGERVSGSLAVRATGGGS